MLANKLLSFLFPNPCVVCNKPTHRNTFVCDACKDALIYIGRNSVCKTCLAPIPSGDVLCGACLLNPPAYEQLISCVRFAGPIRKSLHRYKFRGRSDLGVSFGKMMCEQLALNNCTDFDVVIPVPLSKKRLRERGYNQSALLAKEIAKEFSFAYNETALLRKKDTARQSSLAYKYREYNVRGAFALYDPLPIKGKRVLLIDDIFTTGATVRAAVKPLQKYASSIAVCTVAKTVLLTESEESIR